MSEKVTVKSSGGITFGGLLTIVFIVLKLTGIINWSWLWVLCPLWIGLALVLGIGAMALVIGAIALSLGKK